MKIEQIRNATSTDVQMQTLTKVILDGWTTERKHCTKMLIDYWFHRDEMSCEDGIIFKGQKLMCRVCDPECVHDSFLVSKFQV